MILAKGTHYTLAYTIYDTTPQDGDLNALFQLIWLYISISQWLKYQTSEPQIKSLDPPGVLTLLLINTSFACFTRENTTIEHSLELPSMPRICLKPP